MNIKFVFFGSSEFSNLVLKELEEKGFVPELSINSAKLPLDREKLESIKADVFIVASFGKILPDWLIYMPRWKTLNVHPSLLPKLRGPSPIQGGILSGEKTGVTIQRINEKVDEGPILVQKEVALSLNLGYIETEKILAKAGGEMLAEILPKYISGEIKEIEQPQDGATYTKMVKKEDGLIDFNDSAEKNLRKIHAFERWPGAYFFFTKKNSEKVRVVIKKAEIVNDELHFIHVVPEGKREMVWDDFLKGNS